MNDGLFQCSFTFVIVDWSPWFAQEKGQWSPPFDHVFNGLAEAGRRLDELVREQSFHPDFEILHDRRAVLLVERETRQGGQPLPPGQGIVVEHVPQRLDEVLALVREVRGYVHELAPAMDEATGHEGPVDALDVVGEAITHLDRLREAYGPPGKDIGQVLSRVLVAGEVEGDGVVGGLGDDSRRVDADSLTIRFPFLINLLEGREIQNPHRRIVVVQEVGLGRLADQLLVGRFQLVRGVVGQLPLRALGERDALFILPPLRYRFEFWTSWTANLRPGPGRLV